MGIENFPLLTTRPKKRAPKKHTIKTGVSAKHFLKNRCASRNGHLWTKTKPKPEIPVIMFWAYSFLFQQEKHKNRLKPLFYSVLANLKKRNFNIKLKTENLGKKNKFCTLFFWKGLFLENWQIIGHTKNTHKMISEQKKIAWSHNKYRPKITLAQLVPLNLA